MRYIFADGNPVPMRLEWLDMDVQASCPACGAAGRKEAVVRSPHVFPSHPPVTLLRCSCGAAFLEHLDAPDYSTEWPEMIDYYVEQGAGIDLMVAPLVRLEHEPVRRYLEIGCGFGFSLDFARLMFGWDVLGVDPSSVSRAGSRALGFPLHSACFGSEFVPDEPYDVVVAWEIIEHVTDPHSLLRSIRDSLTPDGLAIFSTPNVSVIRRGTDEGTVGRALSPGFHVILYDRTSLAAILEKAGFAEVYVEESPETLHAWASLKPGRLAGVAAASPARHTELVISYLDRRASSAPPASALASGLAYRHFKSLVNAGMYAQAKTSLARLARVYRDRYAIDLARPETIQPAQCASLPCNFAGALFFQGILELNANGDNVRAAACFRAASEGGAILHARQAPLGVHDGENDVLLAQSRKHLPMALASFDAAGTEKTLQSLALLAERGEFPLLAETRTQTFVRLVNAGAFDAAERLAVHVRSSVDASALRTSGERNPGEADPLFALGMLALQRHRFAEGAAHFHDVFEALRVRNAPDRTELLWSARYHQGVSLRRAGQRAAGDACLSELTAAGQPGDAAPPVHLAEQARKLLGESGR